jgi:hypothetical protein
MIDAVLAGAGLLHDDRVLEGAVVLVAGAERLHPLEDASGDGSISADFPAIVATVRLQEA